jgi:opacity protein-like surface antigen
MKKLLAALVVIVTCASVNAQFTKVGGGLTAGSGIAYNNESDLKDHRTTFPALTVKGIYEITLPLHVSPSFTWYYPRVTKSMFSPEESSKHVISALMADVNGHYVINSLNRFEIYALAGLNLTFIKSKWKSEYFGTTTSSKDSDNSLGLNLGAGTYIKMTNQFDLFAEAKYIISKYDQFIVNAGILINIDWLMKNENAGL